MRALEEAQSRRSQSPIAIGRQRFDSSFSPHTALLRPLIIPVRLLLLMSFAAVTAVLAAVEPSPLTEEQWATEMKRLSELSVTRPKEVPTAVSKIESLTEHNPRRHVQVLIPLVGAQLRIGELGAARSALEHAEEIAKTLDDPAILADLTYRRMILLSLEGDTPGAIAAGESAARLFEKLGKLDNFAGTLSYLGASYDQLGRREDAAEALTRALALARESKNQRLRATSAGNLGNAFIRWRRYDAAVAALTEAAEAFRALHDPTNEGRALVSLSDVWREKGDFAASIAAVNQALPILRSGEHTEILVSALASLGVSERKIGHLSASEKALDEAWELQIAKNIAFDRGSLLTERGITHYALGDQASGLKEMHEAVEWAEEHKDLSAQQSANQALAEHLAKSEDYRGAYEAQRRAYDLQGKITTDESDKQRSQLEKQYQTQRQLGEIQKLKLRALEDESALERRRARQIWLTFWVVATSGALVAAGGFLVHLRKKNRQLRHREELQMDMIESSPVPMLMLDDQHRVLYANATFTRVFGYSAAELPDILTWWELACPNQTVATEWTTRLRTAAANHRPIEAVETTLMHRDGSIRHTVITSSTVGERTLMICSDLTERKRADDERQQLQEQLRQGQKMESIGRLAGGIAHDFNNLLTVIIGNVTLLELDHHLPQNSAESIRGIKSAAKRAAHLTSQLLAFSRKQPIQVASLDLNQAVKELTIMLRRIVGEDIRMELSLAPGAVPTRGDQAKLEQMILNLVLNARDAMPKGGQLVLSTAIVDVAVGAVPSALHACPGRFARISVRDTGCGISPDIMPRIFDPFFTTKEVGKGTGLGLATVFGIVEQHEGWIDVQSTVSRGTTFDIYLPEAPNAPVPPSGPVEESAARSPRGTSCCCILLVEDDAGVRNYACRTLVHQGHRVLEAASGRLALPVWEQHRHEIDILFTDVIMPDGINGLELAQRLQKEKPTLKVIYTSGYSAEVAGGDFTGRQGIDFIGKPYLPADLVQIVEQIAAGLPPAIATRPTSTYQ